MIDATTSAGIAGGYIDTILLKVISMRDCYGYSIYRTLSDITDHAFEMKEASMYSGLRRLETDRLVSAYWGDETQGGRRKYYTITDRGREALSENVEKWNKTKSILDRILEWKGEGA